MSLKDGVYTGSSDKHPIFVGWDKAPGVDRRFLLGALPVSLAATTGLAYTVSSQLDDPGPGAWLTNATHDVTGVLASEPYPMIRVADENAPFGMRTVLVVAQGKCTSGLELEASTGNLVSASGVLIERGSRRMLEVPLALSKWISPASGAAAENLVAPPVENLGRATLSGMIMDSKCFFGVMKPARGRTHKACASLCIRGGIPPSFWVRDGRGGEAVLLMTDADGGPLRDEILPLVAERTKAEGEILRVGDLLQFRADASAYDLI